MLGYEEKVERIELIDAVCDAGRLARGLDQLLESWRTPTSWTRSTSRGPGPEVDKREVRRAHRGRRVHPGGAE